MTAGVHLQLKTRIARDPKREIEALAKRRRVSVSRLAEALIQRELGEEYVSDAVPDECAVREMTILLAVEQSLKLLEANTSGGPSRSKRLLDGAGDATIARLEMVDAALRVRPE